MPGKGVESIPHNEILRYEEILKIVDIASELGIKKIRLTGGEPLVRKGVVGFVSELSKRNLDFSLTTNAMLLADCASELKRSGLKRINISLDTMSDEKYSKVTRCGVLANVVNGILAAKKAGISPIKINTVVFCDTDENDIENLIEFSKKNGFIIRFIEQMPFVSEGEDKTAKKPDIEEKFKIRYNLKPVSVDGFGPGRYYRLNGAIVGFISAISAPFCEKCNRLRLTSDGRLMPCLGSNDAIDIKKALRSGVPDEGIKSLFREAVLIKPERHSFKQPKECMPLKNMSGIGG